MTAKNQLKREIGKFELMLISFAGILGSGWLFAPLYAAQIAGPGSLLAWVLGIGMAVVIGLTVAEVMTLFPKIGGLGSAAAITHGSYLAVYSSILNGFVCLLLPAIEIRAIILYSGSMIGGLTQNKQEMTLLGQLFSVGLLALVFFINSFGTKITSKITQGSVMIKLTIPVLICLAFLGQLTWTHQLSLDNFSQDSSWDWTDILLAVSSGGIIFSFNGFSQAAIFAGEAKNPQKSIPFAIVGSLILSGMLYIFIQATFLVSVPADALRMGWKNVAFNGDNGPFAGIAILLGLQWILFFIYFDAIISPLGTAFAYASSSSRVLYSAGESVPVLGFLKKLNRSHVPGIANWVSFGLAALGLILLPTLKAMISILVAVFVMCYTLAPASLLVLRKTHSSETRLFRLPAPRVFALAAVIFSNLMVLFSGWEALKNLFYLSWFPLLAGGILVYRSPRQFREEVYGISWFLVQLYSVILVGYLLNQKWISFANACVLIFGVSSLVLTLSQRVSGHVRRGHERVRATTPHG